MRHAAMLVYEAQLRHQHDLRPATLRSYVPDLRQFADWCEHTWREADEAATFAPAHGTPRPSPPTGRTSSPSAGLRPPSTATWSA